MTTHLLYAELAEWWPLISAPEEYAEEAESFLAILDLPPGEGPRTLLELGSGGGNLASHLTAHFTCTLTDRSPAMLAVSRRLHPDAEHVAGDMRTLRLGRTFDVVLIHDAIMYCTSEADVRAALATAAVHCRPGGRVLVAPDHLRETYTPHTEHGGHDAPDGRAARYLEWSLPADPSATTFETHYVFAVRDPGGEARVVHECHVEGLFSEREWLAWFEAAGIPARPHRDVWERTVFVGTRR